MIASWIASGTALLVPIGRTRCASYAACAVCAAGAAARTLGSALRSAEANGVASALAREAAIASTSAAVKFSGGSVRALSMTWPPCRPVTA
jgi:hypothetical protein